MSIKLLSESELDGKTESEIAEYLDQVEASTNGNTESAGETEHEEALETKEEQAPSESSNEVSEKAETGKNTEVEKEAEKDDTESAYYKKKEREDLIALLEEKNKYISRQNNELYQVRKSLETLDGKVTNISKAKEREAEDALLDDYPEAEREVVRKLISSEIELRESKRREAAESQLANIEKENSTFYENLKTHPEIFNVVNPELQAEFSRAGATNDERVAKTIRTQGWVMAKTLDILKQENSAKVSNKGSLERSKRAATTNTAASSTASKKPRKSIDDMSADEYLEYAIKVEGLPIA